MRYLVSIHWHKMDVRATDLQSFGLVFLGTGMMMIDSRRCLNSLANAPPSWVEQSLSTVLPSCRLTGARFGGFFVETFPPAWFLAGNVRRGHSGPAPPRTSITRGTPHKPNLSEEIRLGSAEESAVHTAVAEPITRKLEFSDRCFSSPAACPRQTNRGKKRLPLSKCQSQGRRMRLPNYLKPEMKDCWKNQQDLMQLAWREHALFPPFFP